MKTFVANQDIRTAYQSGGKGQGKKAVAGAKAKSV